jgi:hypothetical protein
MNGTAPGSSNEGIEEEETFCGDIIEKDTPQSKKGKVLHQHVFDLKNSNFNFIPQLANIPINANTFSPISTSSR